MKEQINELKFKVEEATPKDKEKGEKGGIEITKGEEMNKVIKSIEEIKNRIDHDKPIKGKDVLKAKEAINNFSNRIKKGARYNPAPLFSILKFVKTSYDRSLFLQEVFCFCFMWEAKPPT